MFRVEAPIVVDVWDRVVLGALDLCLVSFKDRAVVSLVSNVR